MKKDKLSFLIVDDNLFNIYSLQSLLEQVLKPHFEIQVDFCTDGSYVIDEIKKKEN